MSNIDWTQMFKAEDRTAAAELALQISEAADASAYLAETDWYVVRAFETEKPVPDEILAKRAECRSLIRDYSEG